MQRAIEIRVTGRVQGVGFRPYIFFLADKYHLVGTVQNNLDGVRIKVEGEDSDLSAMLQELRSHPPRLSKIDEITVKNIPIQGYSRFEIVPSERSGKASIVIPIDSAVCEECLGEMRDPDDVRYQYPFINCTQCGPRYTIIDQLPYDRQYTSMAAFPMCEKCTAEYHDPRNRRHHAQPIACPVCGPQLKLLNIAGDEIKGDALALTRSLLKNGAIVAIKGLGGYHLACDAYHEDVIKRLRQRKNRPNRPLAVMAASLEEVRRYCHVSDAEVNHLTSPERPIVVLELKGDRTEPMLSEAIAPGMNTLGVMLPYTPLHYLLFDESLTLLVMTSANPSGQPILFRDDQALTYLNGIADYILTHDREILHPLDDSVVRVKSDVSYFFRRSRGYVPDPIFTDTNVHDVVALGGQQKNTFAIGRHHQVFLGPHIGDMETMEMVDFFQTAYEHLKKWMGIEAEFIAVDKHPEYTTTRLAGEMEGEIVSVQHHHAHMVSCMEDNRLTDPCFGMILDGTGYGDDGNIWGFELLYGDATRYERLAHLDYWPLPGGEKAIKEPWRNAVGMLFHFFGEEGKQWAKRLFPNYSTEIELLTNMVRKKINAPLAGTCGRLFDAVSAMLGISMLSTYDGEAAIRLSEQMVGEVTKEEGYSYDLISSEDKTMVIEIRQGLRELVHDIFSNVPIRTMINRFHRLIVSACESAVIQSIERYPNYNRKVVLSGGSFHNPYLSQKIADGLKKAGVEVYVHRQVPCSDGGLSLGQLIIAANKRNSRMNN
ncbi:carbamoyltransferase HypF [Microaerobacter geothermalis]|uniref:carbamoyltransferase HypF n=1 Tax=Microaerobacter geothermalis TaxID=674972 RepID=UPI001F33CD37|nr:carbamoyltransferase HypF [Microaerobacter geothermalis]MCF6092739.1 carbamoyltransferase HypF [Microaerobacter geothermalis]